MLTLFENYIYFCAVFSFEIGKSLVEKLVSLASCGSVVTTITFVGISADELKSTLSLV